MIYCDFYPSAIKAVEYSDHQRRAGGRYPSAIKAVGYSDHQRWTIGLLKKNWHGGSGGHFFLIISWFWCTDMTYVPRQ